MKPVMLGGIACLLAALLHVGIIVGGPDWYRFFGAGEETAQLVEHGSTSTMVFTSGITVVLAGFGLYGVSGTLGRFRLPFRRTALALIATLFLVRGLIGVPLVFLVDDPYMAEMRGRMVFVVVTSALSLGIGVGYLHGLIRIRTHGRASSGESASAASPGSEPEARSP